MQGIKNIIFDLGGVLINLDNKLTEKAFVDLGAKDFARYFGHGFAASFFKEYEIGKISDQEFINNLRQLGNLNVPDETIIEAWDALLLDFPPERIALLKKLRTAYRVFLFSNTNALHMKTVRKIYNSTFRNETLDELFEKAYYSNELGMRKPDVISYLHITNENKLIPSETLFVDDASVNVEGANKAGLQGYFLEPGKTILDIDFKVYT
ncbi:MAG TPA: HAD family phosphatase [Puia sp.]|nr:HAD family phosphatase [Puia sp.]